MKLLALKKNWICIYSLSCDQQWRWFENSRGFNFLVYLPLTLFSQPLDFCTISHPALMCKNRTILVLQKQSFKLTFILSPLGFGDNGPLGWIGGIATSEQLFQAACFQEQEDTVNLWDRKWIHHGYNSWELSLRKIKASLLGVIYTAGLGVCGEFCGYGIMFNTGSWL